MQVYITTSTYALEISRSFITIHIVEISANTYMYYNHVLQIKLRETQCLSSPLPQYLIESFLGIGTY